MDRNTHARLPPNLIHNTTHRLRNRRINQDRDNARGRTIVRERAVYMFQLHEVRAELQVVEKQRHILRRGGDREADLRGCSIGRCQARPVRRALGGRRGVWGGVMAEQRASEGVSLCVVLSTAGPKECAESALRGSSRGCRGVE